MFSATMRLEDSAVDKVRREEFVDSILTVSLKLQSRPETIGLPLNLPLLKPQPADHLPLRVTRKSTQSPFYPSGALSSSLVRSEPTSDAPKGRIYCTGDIFCPLNLQDRN